MTYSRIGDEPGKRRVILHVGPQKTGSTSIQRFLNLNAALLADDLIVRTPTEGSPMRPLGRAAIDFSFDPEDNDSREALKLAFDDVLDTFPSGDRPVLISHENLAGAMPGNGGETRLYPALPRILTILRDHAKAFRVEFVYYTRPMAKWKPSVWAQAVRTDGYTKTRKQFMDQMVDLPGWNDLKSRLEAAVGSECLTRLRLENENDLTRPGRQLLRLAGLEDAQIASLKALDSASMPRLHDTSTEFIRHLNMLNLNPHARLKVVNLVARQQHLFNLDPRPEGTL